MIAPWLLVVSWMSIMIAVACVIILVLEVRMDPQRIPIVNWVWPITAIYAGPLAEMK